MKLALHACDFNYQGSPISTGTTLNSALGTVVAKRLVGSR